MLTAQDKRPQPVGRQGTPMAWNIARYYDSQGEKVGETQHIKIGLVDGIDRLDHPLRNQRFEKSAMPGHHDEEREENPGNGYDQRCPRLDQKPNLGRASHGTPCPEEEHELPRIRVEIPMSSRRI